MADEFDDEPRWKRILTHELVWTAVAALAILAIAFALAT